MPSFKLHLAEVKHNKKLVRYLGNRKRTLFPGWYITGLFCTAIHCVEAYLAIPSPPHHSKDHGERIRLLQYDNKLGKAFLHNFRDLKNLSQRSRYLDAALPRIHRTDLTDALMSYRQIKNRILAFIKTKI